MDEARAAVAQLAETDEDDLYRLLALRVRTVERDPTVAGQFAPATMAATGSLGIAVPDLPRWAPLVWQLARARRSLICARTATRGSTSSACSRW